MYSFSQERVDNACANSKIKIRKPRSARDTEAEDCRFICDLVKSKVKDCGKKLSFIFPIRTFAATAENRKFSVEKNAASS